MEWGGKMLDPHYTPPIWKIVKAVFDFLGIDPDDLATGDDNG